MADDTPKGDKPSAQIYRFAKSDARLDEMLRKDLGPNGGANPNNAVQGNAFEPEDEYQQLYVGATRDQGIVQPPYNLRQLDYLSQNNNSLGPCIEAMVTNVDGTGYDFESIDKAAEDASDDSKIEALKEFFREPWPGMSFIEMRKLLRRDLERTGNGYLEILRNAQDQVVMFRRVDSKMMRMLRLDDAIPVNVTVTRNGKPQTISVMQRERRYCQLVNGVSLMYFKEFGSTRDLHKKTAVWAPAGQRLPAQMRATEIMHFTVLLDAHTPYGIPRWVNQMPSVLGSRKAEEFNLDYFDNGGVPPLLILLQGGTLQAETRKALEAKTTGSASKNNRVQVLEVESVSGGSLSSPVPPARVTVERFGGDRATDSMFSKYDDECYTKVRRSFRMPPIFVGAAQDYTFASAFASYTVAEAQVFKPERDEIDTVFSMRLLPALGFPGYRIRSKSLVIEDATLKLQGIEVIQAMGDQVEPADIVKAVNELAGLHLKISDVAPTLQDKADQAAQDKKDNLDALKTKAQAAQNTVGPNGQIQPINPAPKGLPPPTKPLGPAANGGSPGTVKPKPPPKMINGAGSASPGKSTGPSPAKKADEPLTVQGLGIRVLKALRKRDVSELAETLPIVTSLDPAGRAQLDEVLADLMFVDPSYDPAGLAELSACTLSVMAGMPHDHHDH